MSKIVADNISPRGSDVTIAGVGTFSSSGVNLTGVVTATSFVGNVTGNVEIGAGSTSAPSLAPSGDSNTGIFFPSADTIAFAEGGSEAARIDSSGRLLLGTNTNRQDFFNFSSAYGARVLSELAGNSDGLRISYAAVRNSDSVDSGFLVFGKSRGTTVGSATTVQDGDALGEISFQGADGSELVVGASIKVEVDGTPGANDMPGRILFRTTPDGSTSTTTRMTIDSIGRLLVGTTESRGTATPAVLQIAGGNGSSSFNKVAIISGNNEDAGGMLLASSASNSIQIQADPDNQRASSKISFFIDGNERAAIDASANISIENNGSILFKSNGSRAYFNDAAASSVGTSSIGGSTATLFIGNASIQVSSDIRLKENVEDTQIDALDAISRINVKDFTWNDPSDTSHNNRNARGKWTGLIAQELVEVLPFVVNAPRKEEDGSIDHDSESIWTLDQSQLCPVLIKAIQQQQEIIASLEARLTALEGN